MPDIIGCITETYDLRLVLIACVICAIGSLTTLQLLTRAQTSEGLRWLWIGASGVAFGCGIWVTHFIAMLAYTPKMPIAFEMGLTSLSLLCAVVGGTVALACAASPTLSRTLAAGVLLGATIGVMHFVGTAALQVPGLLVFDRGGVAAAWLAGLVFAPLALLRFRGGHLPQAVLLLVLAVAGLHFIAMAAISIVPDRSVLEGVATMSLAVAVGAVGLLILLASLGTALVDKHLEGRATTENARFRRFADATFEGLFFLDGDIVSDANSVICDMLGYDRADLIGAPIRSFVAPDCCHAFDRLRTGTSSGIEIRLVEAGGDHRICDVLARSLGPGDRAMSVLAVRDATERKQAERRIKELAQIDPLTGLSNRMLLHECLGDAIATADRLGGAVAVLCVDLDRFKAVNDGMGHKAGDDLLIEVAGRLRSVVRGTDTVARLGGDEFIVVQPLKGRTGELRGLGDRLVELLAAPYLIEGRKVEVSASIGIALYPADAASADTLIKCADVALYRAKREGRHCCRFFDSDMDAKERDARTLEHDVRQALGNGELHLHYQPVFRSERLELTSYEALLRWRHPTRGSVSPGEFIPIAEDCGAILAIGLWVLETACAEAASWREPYGIAVNLSPAQFAGHDLPHEVAAILLRTGLPASRLELEVTEGVLIGDTEHAITVLRALKDQGIRIALDDFGTGYSSLSYLRRFRFDGLKIDRSFVAELGVEPDAEAIVCSILAMSKSLNLEVTAEGIETEQQLDLLRLLRCDRLQGYLLGRPAARAAARIGSSVRATAADVVTNGRATLDHRARVPSADFASAEP
jgi:diguanylate cyclase (GGDEF)-like protein/PAS domain S-box-containing protein